MSIREHHFRHPDPISVADPSDSLGGRVSDEDRVLELQAQVALLSSELRRSQQRYRRLVDTIPAATYILDSGGRIVEINAAGLKMLGRPAAEVIGSPVFRFLVPEDVESARRGFDEHLAGERGEAADRVEATDVRIVLPSGERRVLQVSATGVREGGTVVGLHCAALDVTEERSRLAQLRRAERMASVGPLLRGICHEINNPLTSIKSFAELLLLDERAPDDCEALEIIQREAHRASHIISDLRVVARETQEAGTGRSMVDLSQTARQALLQRQPALERAGIRVETALDPALPRVWVAAGQIEQVVDNLLSNAEQAMRGQPGERVVTVRTYAGGEGVMLAVGDTGHGIAPEDQDRIFDPFWTTRAAGEGTGLGLSLAHSILADHAGCIHVESAPGRGATFVLDLPAVDRPPVGTSDADGTAPTTRGLRLLVADDEAPIRHALSRYLERRGHDVDVAADGDAAVELLEREDAAYDLILADFWMPGLNGGELLDRLRERDPNAASRLVFMTGDSVSDALQATIGSDDIVVVQKPFELAEIAQVVEAQAGLLRA